MVLPMQQNFLNTQGILFYNLSKNSIIMILKIYD